MGWLLQQIQTNKAIGAINVWMIDFGNKFDLRGVHGISAHTKIVSMNRKYEMAPQDFQILVWNFNIQEETSFFVGCV